MSELLDWSGAAIRPFRPRAISEFFALQLARYLEDEERLPRYLNVAERYSQEQILRAWTRARKRPNGASVAHRFEEEIRLSRL